MKQNKSKPKFDRYEYMRGRDNRRYGAYDKTTQSFRSDVVEKTPMLAHARLCFLDERAAHHSKWRIEVLPPDFLKENHTRHNTRNQYGIWNTVRKEFQFGICTDSADLAVAELVYRIGDGARRWRFEPRRIPEDLIPIIRSGKRKHS